MVYAQKYTVHTPWNSSGPNKVAAFGWSMWRIPYHQGSDFCLWISWIYKCFPKIGVPQNGWFIMENPIKDGWFGGTTIFRKHPIYVCKHVNIYTHAYGTSISVVPPLSLTAQLGPRGFLQTEWCLKWACDRYIGRTQTIQEKHPQLLSSKNEIIKDIQTKNKD